MLPTMVYARFFIFQIHWLLRGRLHTGEFRRVCTRCGRTIDANDALSVLRASVGLTEIDDLFFLPADVDGDELITSTDAPEILRYSVEIIDPDSKVNTPVYSYK